MKSSSSAAKPAGSSRLGRWPAPTNSRASAPGIVRAAWRERSAHAENPGRPRPPASARRRPPGADRRGGLQRLSARGRAQRDAVHVQEQGPCFARHAALGGEHAVQQLARLAAVDAFHIASGSAWRSSSICACTGGSDGRGRARDVRRDQHQGARAPDAAAPCPARRGRPPMRPPGSPVRRPSARPAPPAGPRPGHGLRDRRGSVHSRAGQAMVRPRGVAARRHATCAVAHAGVQEHDVPWPETLAASRAYPDVIH